MISNTLISKRPNCVQLFKVCKWYAAPATYKNGLLHVAVDIALSCIDTIEVILIEWHDTGGVPSVN